MVHGFPSVQGDGEHIQPFWETFSSYFGNDLQHVFITQQHPKTTT